jgi:peptidoglycan/LPS O-acetylase OafA/YrhL
VIALKRLACIDALRGYAVLGVVLVHTIGDGAAFGARGVQLFFVVSAFTLMHSWRGRDDGAFAFFVRRVFRIAPMFWLSIPVSIALIGWQGLGLRQVLTSAAFLQAATPQGILAPIVAGGWSIDVELAFYCLFPLLAKSIRSLSTSIAFLAIAFVISDQWHHRGFRLAKEIYPSLAPSDVATFIGLSLPAQLPAFAAGFVAFHAIPRIESAPRIALDIALICALLSIGYFALYDTHNVFAFSLCFGTALATLGAGAGTWLVNPLIILIGRCSFSIYLLHFIVIDYASKAASLFEDPALRLAALFILTVAITTAISILTFNFIERPMISLGNRLIRELLGYRQPKPVAV